MKMGGVKEYISLTGWRRGDDSLNCGKYSFDEKLDYDDGFWELKVIRGGGGLDLLVMGGVKAQRKGGRLALAIFSRNFS